MQIDHDAQILLPAPADGVVKQLERLRLLVACLIPELLLIDGQPDVVETEQGDEFDVLFREEPLPGLAASVALREPVADIGPPVNLERPVRHAVPIGVGRRV